MEAGNDGSGAGNPIPEIEDKYGIGKGRSQGDIDRINRETAREIVEANKTKGNVPAGWLRKAEEFLTPPQINPLVQLRAAVLNAIAQAKGKVDYTYSKPNQRREKQDVVLPSMFQPKPRLGIIVDTSGSMTDEELGLGLVEIKNILRTMNTEIWFAAIDCKLHSFFKVTSFKQIKAAMKGGGGSSLVPAYEEMEKKKLDIYIVITDCEITFPNKQPK
jgi:predicted metal-dependent peptidase